MVMEMDLFVFAIIHSPVFSCSLSTHSATILPFYDPSSLIVSTIF